MSRPRSWLQSRYVTSTFLVAIHVCHIRRFGCNPCMSHPRSWLKSILSHSRSWLQSMCVTSTFLIAIHVCHIHVLCCNPYMSHPRSWLPSMYVTSTFLVALHVCHIRVVGCNPCMSHPRSWLSLRVTSTFLVSIQVCRIHRSGCNPCMSHQRSCLQSCDPGALPKDPGVLCPKFRCRFIGPKAFSDQTPLQSRNDTSAPSPDEPNQMKNWTLPCRITQCSGLASFAELPIEAA